VWSAPLETLLGVERTTRIGTSGPLAGLVCVSAIWGATYAEVKQAVSLYPAFSFLALRFGVAALALAGLAAALGARRRYLDLRTGGASLLLGTVLAAGFALHVLGLGGTSATTAGFVTGLLVPLTPVWAIVVLGERAGRAVWIPAALATAGVAAVAGGGVGAVGPSLLLAGGAAAFSLHIVLTRRFALDCPAFALTTLQLFVAALALVGVAFVHDPVGVPSDTRVWVALVVSGLGGTALAFALQTWAERRVTASQTAIVLTLEPVFAAAFGYALAGDRLSGVGIAGCISILVAMLASLGSTRRRSSTRSNGVLSSRPAGTTSR
jgi:drug/metabolite transporter (DMT)-like permease